MSQEFLESKRQQINMFAQNNSPKSILDVFGEVRSNVGEPTTFYDFVGRTFLDNTEFYSSKFFKVYNKKISKYLNPNELFEMEQYILKNYCLYQNEKIITSFNGEIGVGSGKMVGRIYITNFRIILQGSSKSKGVPMVTQSLAGMAIAKSIQRSIIRSLQQKLSELTTVELPCFGNQYPMFGLEKIKLKGRQVNYRVFLETQQPNGKISKRRYAFQVRAYGDEGFNLAQLVYNTIMEADKAFN